MQTEQRTIPLAFEVRAANGDEDAPEPRISGHAAVFNSPSLDLGGFREIIDPRAFKRTLREKAPIRSYFNHSPMHVLGRTDNKTLTVRVDETGLAFEVVPPDTQWARDLMASMQRGDIRDASFAFRVVKDAWSVGEDGTQVRTLLDVDLMEVGPVAMGAYPAADSAVRSMLEARGLEIGDDGTARVATIEQYDETHQADDPLPSVQGQDVNLALRRWHLDVLRLKHSPISARVAEFNGRA